MSPASTVAEYSTVTLLDAARFNVTVKTTAEPSVADASAIVSSDSTGVNAVVSGDAGPSARPAFVASTRTVYAVPPARPVIVWVVVAPEPMTASRASPAAAANVCVPERHCTLYPSAPDTARQSTRHPSRPRGQRQIHGTCAGDRPTVTVYVRVVFPSSAVTVTSMGLSPTDSATW